jgi:hypothetical protein
VALAINRIGVSNHEAGGGFFIAKGISAIRTEVQRKFLS